MSEEIPFASNFVAGKWLPALDRRRFSTVNPATGESLGWVADGDRADAEAAIAAARRAFDNPAWAQNPRRRQMVLTRWADRLELDMERLARLLTLTNGKPLSHSAGEVGAAISEIRYYAGLARHIPGHAMEVAPGEFATTFREPAGVAGLIVPWNAPGVLLVRALAPAIAAGCCSVIKVAPQTALFTARMIEALADVTELPAGAVNLIHESGNAGSQLLVESDLTDVISFTGSTSVGKQIMAAAAGSMKKLSLELGGKSCCVVFADADIVTIAPRLAQAATIISGQQCTAARRILVHESRYDEMKAQLSAALAAQVVGPGTEPATTMGPLIDRHSRDRVKREFERTYDSCDEVIVKGGVPEGSNPDAAFLTPALVAQGDENAFFCQEEIFGPLVVLERFSTEEEAARKANNTVYGLSASVWTNDNATAWRLARALKNGTIWINDHNKLFAEAETGGYRHSGLGRLHGYDALADFTELKNVYQNVGVLGASAGSARP